MQSRQAVEVNVMLTEMLCAVDSETTCLCGFSGKWLQNLQLCTKCAKKVPQERA